MDAILPTNLSSIKFVFELPSINQIPLPDIRQVAEHLTQLFTNYWQFITFYLPLGIIGFWRWGTWVFKKIVGLFYRPQKGYFTTSVSIITPVYNETHRFL